MTEDTDLERTMRAALGIPNISKEEAEALKQVREDSPPVKVLVRKERVWGIDALHWRYFFIGVNADGSRRLPFTTTNEGVAKSEALRYQKLGIPMEVMKEVEFE